MPVNPQPLSDEEIAEKYEVEIGTPEFATAKKLTLFRPDTTLNDFPEFTCPHCGKDSFQDDYGSTEVGDEIECPKCERTSYVTFVDVTINVTLSTHPDERIMHTYLALYRGKKIKVQAETSYDAQQAAAKQFKAKKSYEVDVFLCDEGNQPSTATITSL